MRPSRARVVGVDVARGVPRVCDESIHRVGLLASPSLLTTCAEHVPPRVRRRRGVHQDDARYALGPINLVISSTDSGISSVRPGAPGTMKRILPPLRFLSAPMKASVRGSR